MLYSFYSYYKILTIFPFLFQTSLYSISPNTLYLSLIYPCIASPPVTCNHRFVLCIYESISVLLLYIPHTSDITKYLSFSVWRILLNIITSSPCMWLQIALVYSFLWLNSVPLFIYTSFFFFFFFYTTPSSWSIPLDLGCFHILAIVSNAAVNTGVYVSLWISDNFFDIYPRVELLDHMVVLFSVVCGTAYCFPQWLHQFTLPPAVYKGSLFSISSSMFVILCSFWWQPFWEEAPSPEAKVSEIMP